MTSIEMIEFIDEFLRDQEDVLHGIEGRDCTKSRKYLEDIKNQLLTQRVVGQSEQLCDYCKKPLENTCCNDCLEEMDNHNR